MVRWLPQLDFAMAFNVFAPLGRNYEGGYLGMVARTTIQWVHRVGALITFMYLMGLAISLWRAGNTRIRSLACLLVLLLCVQVVLGVMNATYLPLVFCCRT